MKNLCGFTDVGVVLAGGGSANRFGVPKLWMDLNGKPVFAHSLDLFLQHVEPTHVVLVIPENEFQRYTDFLEHYPAERSIRLVVGGESRSRSVLKGLKALPETARWAVIHDAARPLLSESLLQETVSLARATGGGVIACAPVTDTVKILAPDGAVGETLNRENLLAVQTPQVFDRRKLIDAYETTLRQNLAVTDDASAYSLAGHPVRPYLHTDPNLKITYPHDLACARAVLSGEW